MATEEQELKLRVTLDDQATAQLTRIRQEVTNLQQGGQQGGFQQLTRNAGDFNKILAEVTKSVGGLGGEMAAVGRMMSGAGVFGAALGGLKLLFDQQMQRTREWSKGIADLSTAAKMAGVQFADFQNITRQFAQSGVGIADATKAMANFRNAYFDIVRPGGPGFQQLMQLAGPQFAGQMAAGVRQVLAARTDVERRNVIWQQGQNVFANEMKRTGDQLIAQQKQLIFYQQWGMPELAQRDKPFAEPDPRMAEIWKQAAEQSKKITEDSEKIKQNWEDVGSVMQVNVFQPALDWLNEMDLKTSEWARNLVLELNKTFSERGPGGPVVPPIGDLLKGKAQIPGAGLGGGGAVPLMGGYGNMPLSTNIDDRRGEVVDENTKQLMILNDNLQKIITGPGGGIGGGGLGGGAAGLLSPGGGISMGGLGGLPGMGGAGAGGGGGGGGAPYGSSVGPGTGEGAGATPAGSVGAGGSGIAGSGGGAPGTRMTRGDRNKNPGNIKRGREAEQFGAIGYDEQGHAIFPTWEAGNAAQAAMLKRLYGGQTIPQMGRRYAEDPNWARGVMKFGNYGPGDIPDMSTPEGMERLQAAIRRQEGTHVPAAPTVASAGGDAGGTPHGYTRRMGERGEFNWAATGALGAPGTNQTTITLKNGKTVRVNAAVADRYQGFLNDLIDRGYPVSDVGGYHYRGKAGGGGGLSMHSWGAAVDVNPNRNAFRGRTTDMPSDVEEMAWQHGLSWGGRFGDPMHFEPMSPEAWASKRRQLEARDMDRSAVDRAWAGPPTRVEGTGKLSVDVKAPKGTSVNAEGGGMFKSVEMNRQTTMEPAAVGPAEANPAAAAPR
jgi:hypothetical protein